MKTEIYNLPSPLTKMEKRWDWVIRHTLKIFHKPLLWLAKKLSGYEHNRTDVIHVKYSDDGSFISIEVNGERTTIEQVEKTYEIVIPF